MYVYIFYILATQTTEKGQINVTCVIALSHVFFYCYRRQQCSTSLLKLLSLSPKTVMIPGKGHEAVAHHDATGIDAERVEDARAEMQVPSQFQNDLRLLHFAILNGIDSVTVLKAIIDLDPGALTATDNQGQIPYVMALQKRLGDEVLLALLPTSLDDTVVKSTGDNLLHLSLLHDASDEIVEEICSKHPHTINAVNIKKQYPLLIAVKRKRSQAVIKALATTQTNVADSESIISIDVVCLTWMADREDVFDILKLLCDTTNRYDVNQRTNASPIHLLFLMPNLNVTHPRLQEVIQSMCTLYGQSLNTKMNGKLPVTLAIEAGAGRDLVKLLKPTNENQLADMSKLRYVRDILCPQLKPETLLYLIEPLRDEKKGKTEDDELDELDQLSLENSLLHSAVSKEVSNPEIFAICKEFEHKRSSEDFANILKTFVDKFKSNKKTFESKHNYENHTDDTSARMTVKGAAGFVITFDQRSETEDDYDWLRFYTDTEKLNPIGEKYSGRKFPVQLS